MVQSTSTEPAGGLVGRDFEGRYRIEAVLGSGGVGVVYRAADLKLSRPVAIKVMQEHVIGGSTTLRKRFEREAKALALLNHPNVVGIIDFGVASNMPYLVMELLKGSTLGELIAKTGPLEPQRAFNILRQILQGLAYVHQQNFVHRDLKPANVFLQPVSEVREHVKLLDFGLAKAIGPEGVSDEQRLTRTGEVFGTPGYIAPEQFSGAPVDERADIYAAGVILFEMLAGRKPFAGQSNELLRNQLVAPIPTLNSVCPSRSASTQLDELFRRMLSRDPNGRHQNIAEFREAVEALEQPAVWIGAHANKRTVPFALASTLVAPNPGLITRVKKYIRHIVPRIGLALRSFVERVMLAGAMAVAVISVLVILVAVAAIFLLKSPEYADQKLRPKEATAPVSKSQKTGPRSTAAKSQTSTPRPAKRDPVAPATVRTTGESTNAPAAKEAPKPATAGTGTPQQPSRPPAVNPWAKNVPKSLAKVRKFINAGEYSTERTVAFLRRYNKAHPGDARGYLMLGGLYMNRKWFNDAAKQYELAYRIDPTCRGDQRMLRDLVKLTSVEATSSTAVDLIKKIYGQEATQVVNRAIADAKEGPAILNRLHNLRDSLE